MNLSMLIQKDKEEEVEEEGEKEIIKSIESASKTIEMVIRAISELKKNSAYLNFKKLVLDQAINKIERLIKSDINSLVDDTSGKLRNRILQNQGMLAAFKKFADLDAMEKYYKVEMQKIQKIIKK